jgi:hypothetical protein
MQNAETVLAAIQKSGTQREPLTRVYRGFDKSERPTLIIRNCPPLVGHELVRSVAPSFRFAAGE